MQYDPWKMTEEQLLTEIATRCEERSVRWLHVDNVHHSRRRGHLRGFPDLLLCGPGGIMFRELKAERARWRGVRGRQVDWKYALLAAGENWAVWAPSHLLSGRIDRELDQIAFK